MMSTTEGELDIEVPHELEDGEIADSDVEDGTYIPLTRPETFNPPSLVHMQIQDEPSDEGSLEESSASDSDGELRRRPKRTKLRPRRPHTNAQDKKNKYNIWCSTLQDDLLTEDMVGCDMRTKNRDYGVESYDYTIKYRLNEEYNDKKPFTPTTETNTRDKSSNKRRHMERNNVKLRLGQRVNSHGKEQVQQEPKFLPDLTVTAEDPLEDIGKDIAEKLDEQKSDLVVRLAQVLGASKAIELYKETQSIEAQGGVLVMNRTRRRTPGGTYFYLLKRHEEVSQDAVNEILQNERRQAQRKIKKARANSRQKVVEQLKQSLTDSELPSLLSRGEATIAHTEHGSNPPPSPATDARDFSSDTDAHTDTHAHSPPPPARLTPPRTLQQYEDDDYLEVMCNEDMDLF